jgi:lysophospholipase L1-like esterase
MQYSYFKKGLICVLAGLLSFSAKSQEPKLPANHLKIVYFGSSVPYGQGATNHKGYTSLFSDILKNRVSTNGYVWETVNISIGGDNTLKVLNRYKTDFLPQNGKYVIFALALGNEGIHEKGQPMFDQFEKNIKILIDKAKSDGYTPVITNSYTRNDYNERDYNFIKKMNLLIHRWDVPSINLLGAIDDLSGHWVNGFWDDGLHPNDAGHAEMSYTIVPSLFDALENRKPMPKTIKGSYIKSAKNRSESKSLVFTPEHIVHPFTTAISFKTGDPGALLQLSDAAGTGTISVNKEGRLVYSSARSGVVSGTSIVNDDKWHKVIITHYYAKGVTMLYCDSALQGTLTEKLVTTNLRIGGTNTPKKLAYRNWLFYRSAMNPDEIRYLAKDSLLKSSLELYAPLDGKKVSVSDPLINLAQSMNTIKEQK